MGLVATKPVFGVFSKEKLYGTFLNKHYANYENNSKIFEKTRF